MKLSPAGLLLALCVAGCAAPAPPPPPPKPSVTPDMVDGLYRGTSTRFQADIRGCPSPGLVTLHVAAGQFDYRWNGRIQVPATILPDGSVQGQFDDIRLTGTLQPAETSPGAVAPSSPRIEGDVSNGTCGIHYTATRRK
jgi:hypothetical protein